MHDAVKICVVGAGASGMIAAAKAAETLGGGVLLVERKDVLGKKILATGNGRCNLTNIYADGNSYYGKDPGFCRAAMEKYPPSRVMEYFQSIGLITRRSEEGRVYPYNEHAAAVPAVLKNELMRRRVAMLKKVEITEIIKEKDIFILIGGKKQIRAQKVILAAGGCAQPALGSNGSGFILLEKLGHKIIKPYPALVQIKTEFRFKGLAGVPFQGKAVLKEDGVKLDEAEGKLLFTEYGLSGIPALSLSRLVREGAAQSIALDFLTDYNSVEVEKLFQNAKGHLGHLSLLDFLSGMVHRSIGQAVILKAGIENNALKIGELSPKIIETLIVLLKNYELSVKGINGFEHAQVTGGGADTSQFCPYTMESRLVPGLYCTGELLDIYGDCGGFNLQWAWASGLLAGERAAVFNHDEIQF